MKSVIYISLVCFIIFGCLETFEPEVGSYEKTLIIDGLFSDSKSPSRVILSRSFDFSENEGELISGSTVVIEDDDGGSTILKEISNGVYESDPEEYQGQIGRSYRLLVTSPDGNQFESGWEVMNESPPIDEIKNNFEQRIPTDPSLRPIKGIQFYLNSFNAEKDARHYRWEWEETYEYLNPHPPRIRAEFGNGPGGGDDEIIQIPSAEFEGFRCWKTERSQEIIIASTESLSENSIIDMPINFVDNTKPDLYTRYSLLVRQYVISENYYEFLRKVEEINETSGGLFDAIPNEIFGNIKHSSNEEFPVLGYFGVGGVSESRIFVGREILPFGFSAPPGPSCEVDTLPLDFSELFTKTNSGFLVLYDYHTTLFGTPIGYLITEPPCIFCRSNGATNVAPDYW